MVLPCLYSWKLSTKSSDITVSDRALNEGCIWVLGNLIVGVYATVTQVCLSSLQEENCMSLM